MVGPLIEYSAGAGTVVTGVVTSVAEDINISDSNESVEEWMRRLSLSLDDAFASQFEELFPSGR